MFKKLALFFSWFLITPIVFFIYFFLSYKSAVSRLSELPPPQIASEVQNPNQAGGQVLGTQITDMRPYFVANLLGGTPLEPYSELMVETADKYKIDYRLIPAIAMKESGGGGAVKLESHNAWGFENGRTYFDSWEQAIDAVGKTLKEKYVDRGLVTPEQIMAVYAPPQLLTGGKWARDINYFFSKLESL